MLLLCETIQPVKLLVLLADLSPYLVIEITDHNFGTYLCLELMLVGRTSLLWCAAEAHMWGVCVLCSPGLGLAKTGLLAGLCQLRAQGTGYRMGIRHAMHHQNHTMGNGSVCEVVISSFGCDIEGKLQQLAGLRARAPVPPMMQITNDNYPDLHTNNCHKRRVPIVKLYIFWCLFLVMFKHT